MNRQRLVHLLGWALACVLLLAVFALYTRSDMAVTLADRLWACVQ